MNPTPGDFHGTANGYNNYGCRCARCRQANTEYQRAYWVRRRAREGQPTASAQPRRDAHEHGRPQAVLRYIDYCLDPRRPVVVDIMSVPSMRQALPEAEAALRAAKARMGAAREEMQAWEAYLDAVRRLDAAGLAIP